MDIKLWQRAEPIVEAALALPEDEQDTYVQEACAGDTALLEMVRELLYVDLEPMAFIEGSAITDTTPAEGTRLDQYELLEEIGQGGMSVVFRALEHGPDYQREIAVKILKKGMDSEDILLRFKQERHIMATLSHPRIATLINAGTTQDGRPYLVMPFFRGTTLITYCTERGLGLRERLTLFSAICRTVAFAHRNLVIHRDLKPGNILVDDQGEPILLDFGIAKLLQPNQEDEGTRTGRQLFTPEYASPEQIAGKPATTATDIFALGVILYQLLVEERPFNRKTPSHAALIDGLQWENPEKPSLRLRKRRAEAERDATPIIFPQQLRGDLDTITLQALRANPERRYATVVQFADDIDAYLSGYPVGARKESLRYVASKWLKRNRALGVTLAAAAVGMLAFTLLLARQVNQTGKALAQVSRERDRATQFSNFIIDIVSVADPWTGGKEKLDAMAVLARASDQIRDEFHDDPQTRASMLHTMGKVYAQVNMAEQGEPLLREALRIRRDHFEKTAGKTREQAAAALAESLFELGRALADRAQHEEAEQSFREVLALQQRFQPEDTTRPGLVFYELAASAFRAGRYEEASENAVNALSYLDQYDDETIRRRAMVQKLIGELHSRFSRFEESGNYLHKALEEYRRVLPGDHPTIAVTLTALAHHYATVGRYEEGIPLVQEALDILDATFKTKHSQHISAYAVLGQLYARTDEYVAAEREMTRALWVAETAMGANHVATAAQCNNLGVLYRQMGRLNEALTMHRRALSIHDTATTENAPGRAATLFHYADILRVLDRLEQVEALLQEAIAIYRKQPETQHQTQAAAYKSLGLYYETAARYQEAVAPLQQAIQIREQVYGPWDHESARTKVLLASIFLALGDETRARRQVEAGIEILQHENYGDPYELLPALMVKHKVLKRFGTAEERLKVDKAVLQLKKQIGQTN